MVTSLNKGILLEASNFKLFTVYHTLSLETKKAVFIKESKENIIKLSEGVKEKIEYLNNALENMEIYEEVIKRLPVNEIKEFSNTVIKELLIKYENNQPNILTRLLGYITIENVLLTIAVSGIVIGGIYLYKVIADTSTKELAEKTSEIVINNIKQSNINTTGLGIIQENNGILKKLMKEVINPLMIDNESNTKGISNLTGMLGILLKRMSVLDNKIEGLEATVKLLNQATNVTT